MARYSAGERFPEFTFDTHMRSGRTVSGALKGKTVFWVLRYIGCTVCRYDVHLIAERYREFLQKNAQVFVVMQSDRAHVEKDLKESDTVLPFEIICDPDERIYRLLSVDPAGSMEELLGDQLDLLKEKGAKAAGCGFSHGDYEGNEQQLPAMFIVDETGTIQYAHYARTIMDMPSVDEVLEML